jgi:hypothetical protein
MSRENVEIVRGAIDATNRAGDWKAAQSCGPIIIPTTSPQDEPTRTKETR